jgi:MoxR-like ATPase
MDAQAIRALSAEIEQESQYCDAILKEIGCVIVGQTDLLNRMLIGLLADGHLLLEGVPGLAKTTAVKALADTVEARFSRVQFTPDLLPADITGAVIYNQNDGTFSARKGPLFANIVLADEINRAPAKVQSALLEAMQERQVTIGDTTYKLPTPFLVLATQNPIELEGTYPLPEAQVDRFLFKLRVSYPDRDEEMEILRRETQVERATPAAVVAPAQIVKSRRTVRRIYMDERVEEYIVDLVRATREPDQIGLARLKPLIDYGASPRATIYLALASKAHAYLSRRAYVTPDDVRAVAADTLRHRLVLSYEAEAEEATADDLLDEMLRAVEVP